MFLPDDLSTDEATLIQTVRRQVGAQRRPTTADERRAAELEADQVAAEMIQAARSVTDEDEPTETLTDQERWWQNLRLGVAALDASPGSLEDFAAMEETSETVGQWLPTGEPSPPARR